MYLLFVGLVVDVLTVLPSLVLTVLPGFTLELEVVLALLLGAAGLEVVLPEEVLLDELDELLLLELEELLLLELNEECPPELACPPPPPPLASATGVRTKTASVSNTTATFGFIYTFLLLIALAGARPKTTLPFCSVCFSSFNYAPILSKTQAVYLHYFIP